MASPGKQAPTSEAWKFLYSHDSDYRKILKSICGIRKLLYYTASIELVVEHAAGGNNFVRVVSDSNTPLFDLDRLGGQYAIGQISFLPNDDDAYEILLYDRKSKKSSSDKPLKPVTVDGQKQVRLIPPNLINVFSSTLFLSLVYYLFFCWIFTVALVWCLGIKFHK